jgi:hypothetical protein
MGFKITISDVFLTILSFKIPGNQNNFSVFNRSPSVTTLNPDVESSQFEFAPLPSLAENSARHVHAAEKGSGAAPQHLIGAARRPCH